MVAKYIIYGAAFNGDGTTLSEAVGSTVTITIASPGVVTWTGHTFVANDVVYLATTGALPTGLTAGTQYFVRNPLTNTFELSLTSGGASIATSGTQSGVHTGSGAGAWNQDTIITNTAPANGTLAAGDAVYIRSKTGNGVNVDIAITLSAAANTYIGSTVATSSAPVKWILDNGVTWPGIDGTMTFTLSSAGTYFLEVRSYNDVTALGLNAIRYLSTNTSSGNGRGVVLNNSSISRWQIQVSSVDVSYPDTPIRVSSADAVGKANECTLICTGRAYAARADPRCSLYLNNPTVQVTTYVGIIFAASVFGASAAGHGELVVVNPVFIEGGGITSGTYVATGNVKVIGGIIPSYLMPGAASNSNGALSPASFFAIDGGGGAFSVVPYAGVVDARKNANFPYLNATLPDSAATKWSWRIYANLAARGVMYPCGPFISKFKTDAGVVTSARAEFVVENTFALTTSNCWVDVSWVDATGVSRFATSQTVAPATLVSSVAAWYPQPVVYGSAAFSKYKIDVPLAGGVKQDSTVHVKFSVGLPAANTDQLVFVCPDIQLL